LVENGTGTPHGKPHPHGRIPRRRGIQGWGGGVFRNTSLGGRVPREVPRHPTKAQLSTGFLKGYSGFFAKLFFLARAIPGGLEGKKNDPKHFLSVPREGTTIEFGPNRGPKKGKRKPKGASPFSHLFSGGPWPGLFWGDALFRTGGGGGRGEGENISWRDNGRDLLREFRFSSGGGGGGTFGPPYPLEPKQKKKKRSGLENRSFGGFGGNQNKPFRKKKPNHRVFPARGGLLAFPAYLGGATGNGGGGAPAKRPTPPGDD